MNIWNKFVSLKLSAIDWKHLICFSKFLHLVDEANFSEGLNFVSVTSSLFQIRTRPEHSPIFPLKPQGSALSCQVERKCIWYIKKIILSSSFFFFWDFSEIQICFLPKINTDINLYRNNIDFEKSTYCCFNR